MNVENVRKLRDLLREVAEKNPGRFFMATWFGRNELAGICSAIEADNAEADPDKCGTCACMAGWCQMAFAETEDDRWTDASSFARAFCGIDYDTASDWFHGDWSRNWIGDITATEAADFLTEQLRDAGAEP